MRRTSGASMFMTDGEPNGDTRAFAAKRGSQNPLPSQWIYCDNKEAHFTLDVNVTLRQCNICSFSI